MLTIEISQIFLTKFSNQQMINVQLIRRKYQNGLPLRLRPAVCLRGGLMWPWARLYVAACPLHAILYIHW